MELLAAEFKELAFKAGLSVDKLKDLIGEDFYEMDLALDQDLSLRKLPVLEALQDYWKLIKSPSINLEYKKINRRTVVQTYKMLGDSKGEKWGLLGTTSHNTLRLETFNNYADFEHFATNVLVDYPAMDFQNTSIRHLSSDAFQVFTLLVERMLMEISNRRLKGISQTFLLEMLRFVLLIKMYVLIQRRILLHT